MAEEVNMPEDVVFQILLWLPVASILRFKSVCKSWLSLLQNPDFIAQHLHHHHHRDGDANLLVLNPDQLVWDPDKRASVDAPCFCPSFTMLFGDSNFQVSQNLNLPHRFNEELHRPHIIASCNGIICLQHSVYTIEPIDANEAGVSLWNPAMKQVRLLPQPNFPLDPLVSDVWVISGFGHDIITDDYKVLRVMIHSPGVPCPQAQIELYTLSSDSWTTMDVVLPVDAIIRDPKSPFPNGIYCWLARIMHPETESFHDLILSFDFSKEVFGTMALPDVYTINPRPSLILDFLNGNLACIDWVYEPPETENWHCKIWVMNKYSVKDSWTQLYTITLESNAFPIRFSKNGKIVWIKRDPVTHQVNLCLCEPVTGYIFILPPQASAPFDLQVVVYKESLVSLQIANGAP